jgi:hypothetical protein
MKELIKGMRPDGWYVYLWKHGDIDRYVGRGKNGRWWHHMTTAACIGNWLKYLYFNEHRAEMKCFLIVEGLPNEAAAAVREISEIDSRGLEKDGTGTLLNVSRGSQFNGRLPRRTLPAPANFLRRQMTDYLCNPAGDSDANHTLHSCVVCWLWNASDVH